MPIGGASIGWDENSPSDSEAASLGDDRIRSVKTSVRIGLDSEHDWSAAGGTVGAHRYGSARPYYGPQSAVSSSGTDGRLMQTSDTSSLFHVGSGGTSYIGGPTVLSLGTFPGTLPQRAQWVMEVGQGVTGSLGSVRVTLPNSGYSGAPFVTVTPYNGYAHCVMQVDPIGGSAFTVSAIEVATLVFTSNITFHWHSVGTRTL